jgi:hypothetical protein
VAQHKAERGRQDPSLDLGMEPDPADTLTLNFWPPDSERINFSCFWCFVIALWDSHTKPRMGLAGCRVYKVPPVSPISMATISIHPLCAEPPAQSFTGGGLRSSSPQPHFPEGELSHRG